VDDAVETRQCPVCDAPHAFKRFGEIEVIACPWAPPGMLYGIDPTTFRRLPPPR